MTIALLSVPLLAARLRSDGWCYLPGFFDTAVCGELRADLARHRAQLVPAAVGRAAQRRRLRTERTDATVWLRGGSAIQQDLLGRMAELRYNLNRELLLGLFDYEAHYAVYPPGGFYRRHLDTFRDRSHRMLSTVCYLNDDWGADDGGELVLWDPRPTHAGRALARILPHGGGAVFFLSREFPHEVLPARRERLSIAGWFRVNGSNAGRADPPC